MAVREMCGEDVGHGWFCWVKCGATNSEKVKFRYRVESRKQCMCCSASTQCYGAWIRVYQTAEFPASTFGTVNWYVEKHHLS
jgi:hypothetical protein